MGNEMPATPVPSWLADLSAVYLQMDVVKLKDELRKHLVGTVENIRHMAFIVRRLDELNVDISDIDSVWLDDLRRVAYGQLLPDIVVAGRRSRRLLQIAKCLPLPEQQEIAADKPIPVMVWREGLGYQERELRPSEMADYQLRQVFRKGRRRTISEQISWLDNPKNARARRQKASPDGIEVDERGKRLFVSGERVEITLKQMMQYVTRWVG